MHKRRENFRKLGFISHDEHKDKVYGKKGSDAREEYEKDLKTELIGDFLRKLDKAKFINFNEVQ